MTSMGTNEAANMARRPWLRKQSRSGEDGVNKKAEEHMSKIAGDFCNWLRDLPGDEASVNTLTESQLRALFDTGKNRPTELIQLTNHSSAFIIID